MKPAFKSIITFTFLLLGCHITNAPGTPNYVIEAFLYENEAITDIKINDIQNLDGLDSVVVPIENANVQLIKNQSDVYELFYNPDTKKYEQLNSSNIPVETGDNFELNVLVGDRASSANTIIPEPTSNLTINADTMFIPDIRVGPGFRDRFIEALENARLNLNWNSGSDFHYLVIESRVDSLRPIFPEQFPDQIVNALGQFRFITEPTDTGNFEIIGLSLATYGKHVVKVYRVNQEYVELFQSETQDSRDLNEPPSNIKNALGIFTSFASDSVFFEVVQES